MRRRILPALLAATFLTVTPLGGLQAQDMAALIADQVIIDGQGHLIAEGGVEVFYQGNTLRAARVLFNPEADTLSITGPITLLDDSGTVVVASQAELSADLTEGVLQSARVVLNRQLQMATSQVRRTGGRYTQLDNTVASSCKVCGEGAPLWEIRAKRVLHDTQEKQIYFDNAQFRVAGVPIAYIPHLRVPDPTLERATGFLIPSIRSSSGLGTGLSVPYFITLGPHRDLLVTPFLATKSAMTLGLRYRQAFTNGNIELNGAVSRDDIVQDRTRNYMTARGDFSLPRGFNLGFYGILVSDPNYILDYALPESDRLTSFVEINRVRRNEYISGKLSSIKSIRWGEINSRIPTLVSDFTLHRRFSGGALGGEAGLKFQTHTHRRSSDDPTDPDGLEGTLSAYGRDVTRTSVQLDWRRNWQLENGMMLTSMAEITADAYRISNDETYGGDHMRVHGALATELRWPWVKASSNGVGHVIEPVLQFVWSPKTPQTVPNEDSLLVEFDEGNLFSLSRFPGADAVEREPRINAGLTYTRIDPAGWSLATTVGRVLRVNAPDQFSVASGLEGKNSDWLIASRLSMSNGLSATQRVLVDDKLEASKAETRFDYARSNFGFGGSYIWVKADQTEERWKDIQELALNGNYVITPNWNAAFEGRYDVEASRTNRAAMGLTYRNECVTVDLSVSRRFTSSTSVTASTDFGLSIGLIGFGSGTAGPTAMCRR